MYDWHSLLVLQEKPPAMCLSLHYIEHNDVTDVRLEVSARNPKATEPYMSTIN